ncbi:MAG: hypothetical protein H6622_13130 [Halobacteriovoraceae bacterium]|nr:hypothetical protein [Halobacteriovoraceae bacterium]
MREESENHECPNCKQMTLHCPFSQNKKIVKCTSCKAKYEISFKLQTMAPGHEEHEYYKAIIKKAKK